MTYIKKSLTGYKAVNPDEAEFVAVRVEDYEDLKNNAYNLECKLEREKEGREHDKQIYEKRLGQSRSEIIKEAQDVIKEHKPCYRVL